MTYEEAIEHLYEQYPAYSKVGSSAMRVGLGNSYILDTWLSHPHQAYRTIHVGGTNGKGSTSHTICSVLMSAGYRVGLYTSPHLVDFRERIRVNGEMISREDVIAFVEKADAEMPEIDPSFFEVTMMMAFDYFRRQQVDVAVIEVGLGGRLDSTNIITPDLSVITNIGLEHTALLGSTLAAIAGEKAGIIKNGIPVVIGERHPETDPVFANKATEVNAPITFAQDKWSAQTDTSSANGQLIVTSDSEKLTIDYELKGLCQTKNAVTVMASIDALRAQGYNIPDESVLHGFANVVSQTHITGRWQKIASNPDMIIDTGHNAHGVRLVAEQLAKANYPLKHIVWGMANDKNPENVLPMLPKDAIYYFTRPQCERAMDENEMYRLGLAAGLQGQCYPTVAQALAAAKKNAVPNELIFIGGSNFVVGEVL